MATHTAKVSNLVTSKIQIFSDDSSLSDDVTFATGDYIDVLGSLGRGAGNCKVIIRGTADITLMFNYLTKTHKLHVSQADTTITMPEDTANIHTIRLVTAGQYEFNFPINSIKIVAYASGGSASNNTTIILW